MVEINEIDIYLNFLFDEMIVVEQDIDKVLHLLMIHVVNVNIETKVPIMLQQMNKYQILMLDYSKMNRSFEFLFNKNLYC
jgi:hypothetical protein